MVLKLADFRDGWTICWQKMAGEEVIKVGEFRNMALPEKGSTLGREEFFGPGKWVRSATTRTSTTRWLICLLSFPLPPSSSAFPLSPFSFTKDIHQEEGEAQEDGVSEKEMRFLGWGRGD